MLSIKSLWAAILRCTNDFFLCIFNILYWSWSCCIQTVPWVDLVFVLSVFGHTRSKPSGTWNQTGIGMNVSAAASSQIPSFHVCVCFSNMLLKCALFQERIRLCMNRVKEITEKKKAARLDKGAAARFVRSALYEPEDKDDRRKSASKKKAEGKSDTPPSKLLKRRWNAEVVV